MREEIKFKVNTSDLYREKRQKKQQKKSTKMSKNITDLQTSAKIG